MAKSTDTAPSATVSHAADFKSAPKKARKPARPVYGPAEQAITKFASAPDATPTELPVHQAFSWLGKPLRHDVDAEFVALTRDVSYGVATILQILYRCYDSDRDDPPLMGPTDSEHLLFLATASARMLAEAADARIDALNDRAGDRGAA
jgi:hypothetical protein